MLGGNTITLEGKYPTPYNGYREELALEISPQKIINAL